MHADHVTGSGKIKEQLKQVKSMISEKSGAQADVQLKEKEQIEFGKFQLECRMTPGHTDGENIIQCNTKGQSQRI